MPTYTLTPTTTGLPATLTTGAAKSVRGDVILRGVAALAGFDLTDNTLGALQIPTVLPWLETINTNLRAIWEAHMWPELMIVEQRYFQDGLWSAGSYADDAIVYHAATSAYYQNTSGGATSETPAADATDWATIEDFRPLLPWSQTGQTVLGEIDGVYLNDPRANVSPCVLGYNLTDSNGIDVLDPARTAAYIWVRYRQVCPTFLDYAAADTYYTGDSVYYESNGRYYTCSAETTGNAPTDTNYWTEFLFPHRFTEYLKERVYSAWLRTQKRSDEANAASSRAQRWLNHERDKHFGQMAQTQTARVHPVARRFRR